jgi:serine/threonine protein kinase
MKTCPVCDTDYPDQHNTCPTDGAVLIVSHELAAGSLVRGKYRITRKLGQGGMGVVYQAEHILLGGQVALKFLTTDLGKDPKFIKRFRQEARAAYKLRHPNIVEVSDLDQAEDGSLFIAMEFVEGLSLRAVLDQAPNGLEIPRALNLVRGIAAGLAAAHAQEIVHRDIKPENILLAATRDGQELPKVLDFGIAAMTAENATRMSITHGMMLTPNYAAPEQWEEMPASEMDGRTDTYALGCVFYEMLTGRTPFHAHTTSGWMKQHMEETPRPPSELRPELADWPGLDELTLRMLAKNRDDRPQDAELLSLLDDLLCGGGQERPEPASETDREHPMTVIEGEWRRPATVPTPLPTSHSTSLPKPHSTSLPKPHSTSLPKPIPTPIPASIPPALPQQYTTPLPQQYQTPVPQQYPTPLPQQYQTPVSQQYPTPLPQQYPTPYPQAPPQQYIQVPSQPGSPQPKPTVMQFLERTWGFIATLVVAIVVGLVQVYAPQLLHFGSAPAPQTAPQTVQTQPAFAHNPDTPPAQSSQGANANSASAVESNAAAEKPASPPAGKPAQTNVPPPAAQKPEPSPAPPVAPPTAQKPSGAELEQQAASLYKSNRFSEAATLFDQACSAGSREACDNLGVMYASGKGVAQDDARAAALYATACNAGNALGCNNLGNIYASGRGVSKDNAEAASLYTKACASGNAIGCSNIGNYYRLGIGVEKDSAKARQFLTKGCKMGNQWGCDRLKEIQ